MTAADRKPESSSSLGPFLVLGAAVVFTGVMIFFLVQDLRFVFAGIPAQAKIVRKSRERHFAFTDADGREHVLRDEPGDASRFAEGETLAIRYLNGDPPRVRLEEDVQPAWHWRAVWVMLGLALTWFGVLLTWGRRPNQRRVWGRGRPGER